MPLTMSSDSKQLILFLLSFIFTLHFHCHIALSSSSSFSWCSLSPSTLFCSPYSPFPSSPLDIFNYEIPSINVNLDSLIDEFSGAPCRRSMAVTDPEGDGVPEEEPQSTTLWPITHRHHFQNPYGCTYSLTVSAKARWKNTGRTIANQKMNPPSHLLQAANKLNFSNCLLVN